MGDFDFIATVPIGRCYQAMQRSVRESAANADEARFALLLRLRAPHKRLCGTELDDVPPMLKRDYRPSSPDRDALTAELETAMARDAAAPEPVTA
jgi:hypothetical protein